MPLSKLINLYFNKEALPSFLKLFNVVNINKGGDNQDSNTYSSISLETCSQKTIFHFRAK